jgi:hypothetical protein
METEAKFMRRFTGIGTAALFLLLGTVAPTYAYQGQQEQHPKPQQQQEKNKKQQDQKKKKQQKPRTQQKQQPAKGQQPQQQPRTQKPRAQQQRQQQPRTQQPQTQQPRTQQQRTQQQPRTQQRPRTRQQQANRPSQQGRPVPRSEQPRVWQQHRARNWQAEHRTWQQRGGYNGYRIPQVHYRRYFGRSHLFRIYTLPMLLFGEYPRFQYGGYWFSLVDPWPQYWSNNWYENDEVYIDYSGDGYYLYNRRYPRDRIAITFYLNVN